MALTLYAWTERYVVPGGAGAANGLDWANAFDITQVAANLAQGRRFNFSGSFTLAATLSWTTGGSAANPIAFRGWNAAKTAVASSLSDAPTIDGVSTYFLNMGSYQIWHGFNLANLPILGSGTADYGMFSLLDCYGGGSFGFQWDNWSYFYKCKFHDMSGIGLDADLYLRAVMCEIYDNGSHGVQVGANGACLDQCFIARNVGAGVNHDTTVNSTVLTRSTLDDNGIGYDGNVFGHHMLIANIFSNNGVAIQDVPEINMLHHNNLYNNTADNGGTNAIMLELNGTTFNPQYVDVANNNYEIQNTSLIGVDVPLLGNINIGAWQSSGGGGGSSFRPRQRMHNV